MKINFFLIKLIYITHYNFGNYILNLPIKIFKDKKSGLYGSINQYLTAEEEAVICDLIIRSIEVIFDPTLTKAVIAIIPPNQ